MWGQQDILKGGVLRECVAWRTSEASVLNASHSRRGRMLRMNGGFRSVSTTSSSASRGWSGKAAGLDLQALRAQVRKLRVRSFMVLYVVLLWWGCEVSGPRALAGILCRQT